MPVRHEIGPGARFVRTIATGVISGDELVRNRRNIRADPAHRLGMHQLADFRGVENFDVGLASLRSLAEDRDGDPFLEPGTRLAIVVESDIAYHGARLVMGLRFWAKDEIEVFQDAETAERWLLRGGG